MDNTTRTDMEIFTDQGMFYAAGGFGYRYNGFGIDITYAYSQQDYFYQPFQPNAELLGNGYFGVKDPYKMYLGGTPHNIARVQTVHHNAVLTILYKF